MTWSCYVLRIKWMCDLFWQQLEKYLFANPGILIRYKKMSGYWTNTCERWLWPIFTIRVFRYRNWLNHSKKKVFDVVHVGRVQCTKCSVENLFRLITQSKQATSWCLPFIRKSGPWPASKILVCDNSKQSFGNFRASTNSTPSAFHFSLHAYQANRFVTCSYSRIDDATFHLCCTTK